MLRFMSFSSGSCGNCYYIGDGTRGLLIDAGVSMRSLKSNLERNNLSFDSFDAILVTHDHLDHIRNLGTFCKKLMKPVYTTQTIHKALAVHSFTKDHISSCRRNLNEDGATIINGIKVNHFVVPHDATQTVGYAIDFDGYKFVIMTDVGRMTDEAIQYASEAESVVIESNYDIDMLMRGPYPPELKMRIIQGEGHLSNDECAFAIRRFWHTDLKNIFLCHLSENNNTPQLAYKTSAAVLNDMGVAGSVSLRCLPRQTPSEFFILR